MFKKKIESWHIFLFVCCLIAIMFMSAPLLFGHTGVRNTFGSCVDNDNDGYGKALSRYCRVPLRLDCRDTDPSVNPSALDYCGMDRNCDNKISNYEDCPTCKDYDKGKDALTPSYTLVKQFNKTKISNDRCANKKTLLESTCTPFGKGQSSWEVSIDCSKGFMVCKYNGNNMAYCGQP